ncbi:MAG: ChbG/HpnK family deacetylase [Chthoniobacterales bacterium]
MPTDRLLIVNADDLGLSSATNRGIFHAHEHGIVTSASLMVRRAAAAEAVEQSRAYPRLSLGLHVDLGEWSCEDGEWRQVYEVVPNDDVAAVEAEIRRQIDSFRQMVGRNPTHLDSHQNVHRDQPLRRVFLKVARQLSLPLRYFNPRVNFCGEFYGRAKNGAFPEGITMENLRRIIRMLPPGVTELCCHPGFDAAVESNYCAERLEEDRVLCDPSVRAELERQGVTLTAYSASSEALVIMSNGMVKSGSTLLTQYMLAMLKRSFPDNGQQALIKATRSGKFTGVGYFLRKLDESDLTLLEQIGSREGPVMIKIHLDVRPLLIDALRSGRIKMTFTHRDPRDTILSGIDHYNRSKGKVFPDYTSVAHAMERTRHWTQMAWNWVSSGLPHVVRYADLISEPVAELVRLAAYLGFDIALPTIEAIVSRERAARRYGRHQFNRGDVQRYDKEMSEADRALCREQLGNLLNALGYPD